MLRVIFDNNANDDLITDSEYLALLIKAEQKGFLKREATHVQLDEINNIPDEIKRNMIYSVSGSVSTIKAYGIIPGVTRTNGWAISAPKNYLHSLMGNRTETQNNWRDILTIATVSSIGGLLVSNDKDQIKLGKRINTSVISGEQFKNYLQSSI